MSSRLSLARPPHEPPGPRRFGFVLIPGFSLVALSCAVDVLRAARLEAPDAGFAWTLLGPDGAAGAVASSSGVPLPVEPWPSPLDALVVVGGERTHLFRDERLDRALRTAARRGTMIGSLSDGAFLVAATGLFDGVRSTIHWKCQSAYRERHPSLDVRGSILEIDGGRFSCAGGTASLDLMLRLVGRTLGWEAAGRIADNYVHDRLRGEEQMQHESSGFRLVGRSPILAAALTEMEASLEAPLPIGTLASRAGTSIRHLDRVFRRHLGVSPSRHYRDMRLVRASGLLRQSGLSVGEIALACGFGSASHLARHFRAKFGEPPSSYRRGG